MYYWTHSEPVMQQMEIIPGKLSTAWPPPESETTGDKNWYTEVGKNIQYHVGYGDDLDPQGSK